MILSGTVCQIVGPVLPEYQAYLGRICTVVGIAEWLATGPVYALDIQLPPYVIGAEECNLRPLIPPPPNLEAFKREELQCH